MSVQLVILGFLKERDYHGYELKKQIQRNMGNWTDIKFGSIYHALKKLVEHGCVEIVGEEKHSGRPDRTIYRITLQGRAEFTSLLAGLLRRFQRIYFDLDIGLFFAGKQEALGLCQLLEKRQEETDAFIRRLGEVKKLPIHQMLPKISEVIMDHTLYHLQAELEWAKMAAQRIRDENLYARPDSMHHPSHPGIA